MQSTTEKGVDGRLLYFFSAFPKRGAYAPQNNQPQKQKKAALQPISAEFGLNLSRLAICGYVRCRYICFKLIRLCQNSGTSSLFVEHFLAL